MLHKHLNEMLGIAIREEAYRHLVTYVGLIHQWQSALNLVAPSTLDDVWSRHMLDSLQLLHHIKEAPTSLIDIGSGGGFPGMVLAILFPKTNVTLIESDRKKAIFLQNVSRETFSPVTIFNERMERFNSPPVPLITSRACAPLSELLALSSAVIGPHTRVLLHKGKQHLDEIKEAQRKWRFSLEIHPSLVHKESVLLDLTSVESLL